MSQTFLTNSDKRLALLRFLKTATPPQRRQFLSKLSDDEKAAVAVMLEAVKANPWAQWRDDPVGFVEQGLGERLWSKQREILVSVRDNKRTSVPACHANGKSHLAARLVAWWVMTHEVGTAQVVTTATSFRQVRNILWSHIRRLHATHNLDGSCLMVEWKRQTDTVAFGFAPAQYNETALQGIHAPNLLVVVDEAGGISDTIGTALEALMTGGNTRLLLLGNPPTDNENSWFEKACNSDLYNTIVVSALDTPNFTNEPTDNCTTCPRSIPAHPIATHLVDQQWVDDVIKELGEESPFTQARVYARFPTNTGNRVIPSTWLEEATNNDNPAQATHIRLGVDVAADGGDEFVIARADGYTVKIIHTSSGSENSSVIQVAQTILHHIHQAETDAEARTHIRPEHTFAPPTPEHTFAPTPSTHLSTPTTPSSPISTPPSPRGAKSIADRGGLPEIVSVKVDAIGVGWGVVGLLEEWRKEGVHSARIVGVNVAERAGDVGRFKNQRAEMWWNLRQLVQPDSDGRQVVRLDVDRKVLGQLGLPDWKGDSSGRIQVVSKADLRKLGKGSPDRAEAVLLALYEPRSAQAAPVVAPISLLQENVWSI